MLPDWLAIVFLIFLVGAILVGTMVVLVELWPMVGRAWSWARSLRERHAAERRGAGSL